MSPTRRGSETLFDRVLALVQLFSVASRSGENNEKLFQFARPLGAALVGIGILVLAIGMSYYTVIVND